MNKKRKLPMVFWTLVWAAIFMALVLLIGISLENKSTLMSLFKSTKIDAGDAPMALVATNAPNQSTDKQTHCDVSVSAFPAGSHRLAFWDPSPFDFSVWTLEPESQTLQKWDLKETANGVEATAAALKQNLICKEHQEAGCIFAGDRRFSISDIQLLGDTGWVELRDADDKMTWIWARHQNGLLRPYHQLGLCGHELQQAHLALAYENQSTWILAFLPKSGALAAYSAYQLSPFSQSEIPHHPTQAFTLGANGLIDLDCRNAETLADGSEFHVLGTAVALKVHSGWTAEDQLWRIDSKDGRWRLRERFEAKADNQGLDRIAWLQTGELATTHLDFFRTHANSLVIAGNSNQISRRLPESVGIPETVLISREEGQKRQPTGRLNLLLRTPRGQGVLLETEKQSVAELPTEYEHGGTPRWLSSQRAAGRYVVIAQSSGAIQIYNLKCSADQ